MDNIEGDVFSLVSIVNVQRDTLQGPYERKEKVNFFNTSFRMIRLSLIYFGRKLSRKFL